MIKKVVFGILTLGIIAILGCVIFMANFDLFETSTETELKTECDYEGLRKIKMVERGGNATTNSSILIYATDCNYDEKESEKIFLASASFIKPNNVSFKWKNFDTLTIRYDKRLDIFERKEKTESIKPEIVFEYIAE